MARRTLLVTHFIAVCVYIKLWMLGKKKKKKKERITFFLSVSLELPAIRGGENTCSGTQVTDDVASGIIFVSQLLCLKKKKKVCSDIMKTNPPTQTSEGSADRKLTR